MTEKATFGAGCFWGVEAAFRQLAIIDAAVGYMGGTLENPTYKDVCTDKTGHVEVVQIEFDPQQVTFAQLLDTFWDSHNPTERNRQGPDIGGQYRSVIFFHDQDQKQQALDAIAELNASNRFSSPIATAVEAAQTFWRAEDYHQRYLEKRGQAHCRI